MNEVLKAISERYSVRGYTDEKLTDSEIKTIAEAALKAPTARNEQEVHVSVVDGDNPLLDEIEQEKRNMMLKNAPAEKQSLIKNNPNNFFYSAPTVLILSADKDFKWSKTDAGIAAQSIALAAQSLGLGSLIIGCIDDVMRGDKEAYFANKACFPENYEFAIAVAVGHKNAEKAPHDIDFSGSVSFV